MRNFITTRVLAATLRVRFAALQTGAWTGLQTLIIISVAHLSLFETTANATTVLYQQGVDNGFGAYTGTRDTYIGINQSSLGDITNTNFGSTDPLIVDGDTDLRQTLIAFDGIIGFGTGQIPLGSTINSATLTIGRNDTTSGLINLNHMLVNWNVGTLTWNNSASLGNLSVGFQADGVDASTTLAGSFGPFTGGSPSPPTNVIDILPAVQAWASGASNFGLVLAMDDPGFGDGIGIWSSENLTPADRPLLTVNFSAPPVPEPSSFLLLGLGGLGLVRHTRRRRGRA